MDIIRRVKLGTLNDAKIRGVQAAFSDLQDTLRGPDLSDPAAWTCPVDPGVDEEPRGFEMTIRGAQHRARTAYAQLSVDDDTHTAAGDMEETGVVLGIGVESGFIDVAPMTFTLYNFDVCALFDGHHYYLGISPGFEYPRRLVHNIFLHHQPFQTARQYITSAADVERRSGLIGELARGLTDRPEMTRLGTRLALIRYVQRHDYERWQ